MAADFPPWSTAYDCLAGQEAGGSTAAMHDQLPVQCPTAVGRSPESPATVIDIQSIRAAETVAGPATASTQVPGL